MSAVPGDGGAWMAWLAAAATLASAAALHAGSPHAPWHRARRRRACRAAGTAAALAGLWLWTRLLGAGAGLCVMLSVWTIGLVACPWLGLSATRAREPE